MEPWQSWAIVLTLGVACYLYYRRPGISLTTSTQASAPSEEPAARPVKKREDTKSKRRNNVGEAKTFASALSSDAASASETSKKQNKNKKTAQRVGGGPVPAAPKAHVEKDENNDQEWAERLAGLKTGTNLQPPKRTENRTRTVKQGAVNQSPDASATSSMTGAEADDDLSPAISPALRAAEPSGNDVSDMLEAPKAGPSVLRVVKSSEPERIKVKQAPKAAPEKETKKQRQNRRKNEERKAQQAEDEKQRRVLMERQMKSAREARGEPARNGMVSSPAPASSAWSQAKRPAAAKSTNTSVPVNQTALLDTFEQDNVATTTSATANTKTWNREMPSEEEQMRMINQMEEDSSWNTVPKGRKGKKKTTSEAPTGSTTGNESNSDAGAVQPPTKVPEKTSTDANPFSSLTNGGSDTPPQPTSFTNNRHPNDSDWAVV